MEIDIDLDQASEGNVLHTLNFEKALRDVVHWLRREQDTLYQYLDHHPSVRAPIVATFRSITTSFPPPCSDTTLLSDDDPTQAPSPSVLDQIERAGSEERTASNDSLPACGVDIDHIPNNTCNTQHQLRRRPVIETPYQEGPLLAPPEQHQFQASPEQVDKSTEYQQRRISEVEMPAMFQPTCHNANESVCSQLDGLLSRSPSSEPLSPIDPQTLKRKRKARSLTKPQPFKRQQKPKAYSDCYLLPENITGRIQDIATFDDIVFIWERLRLLSTSTPNYSERATDQNSSHYKSSLQILPRRQRLEMLWLCIGDNEQSERWATVIKRICQAEFFGQYLDERARFKQWKEHKELGRTIIDGKEEDALPPSHPLTEYVDLCYPETILRDGEVASQVAKDTRDKAKKRFENMVQTMEPWVRFNQRFGKGVFVITSVALRDEYLRTLRKPQLEPLLDLIDASIPCLRDHLKDLSELLSFLIEYGRLPPYKLRLEFLCRDQLESIRSRKWSLKELLELCEEPKEYSIGDVLADSYSPLTDICPTHDDQVISSSNIPILDESYNGCKSRPHALTPELDTGIFLPINTFYKKLDPHNLTLNADYTSQPSCLDYLSPSSPIEEQGDFVYLLEDILKLRGPG